MTPRETREKALAVAQREFLRGVKETTGKNDGPDIEKYLQGDKGLAWCAAFVIWCFERADYKFPGNRWKNRKVSDFWRTLDESGFISKPVQGRLLTSIRPVGSLQREPVCGPPVGPGGAGRSDIRQLGTDGPLAVPAPGDLIFLSRRGQSDAGTGWHMGIVERVTMDNITSIDGNWRDQVSRVHRSWSDNTVVGFARCPPDAGGA